MFTTLVQVFEVLIKQKLFSKKKKRLYYRQVLLYWDATNDSPKHSWLQPSTLLSRSTRWQKLTVRSEKPGTDACFCYSLREVSQRQTWCESIHLCSSNSASSPNTELRNQVYYHPSTSFARCFFFFFRCLMVVDGTRTAERSFNWTHLQRDPPAFGDASASCKPRACTCSQSTVEGKLRMLEARRRKETTWRSHSVGYYIYIDRKHCWLYASCFSLAIQLHFFYPVIVCIAVLVIEGLFGCDGPNNACFWWHYVAAQRGHPFWSVLLFVAFWNLGDKFCLLRLFAVISL